MVISLKSRWHCVRREMKFHPHLSLESGKMLLLRDALSHWKETHSSGGSSLLTRNPAFKKIMQTPNLRPLSHRAHVTATTDLSSRVLTHRPLTPCRCSSVSGLSRCEEALSASDLGWNEGDSLPVANPGLMEQERWQKMPPPFGSPSDRKV